ncbi:ABC transporter ATP-binding protein [Pontibaca methylaminivorans]|uniref:Iron complex transport system ATP-binding protein n=1 Tax=Pontibaca methylaminivorans TaxID=515897 RepID=A0A1R3WBK7_9RHOB|nr:ABC transporter ATP-binding protein [Pontibaca methylaminivorans]SIT75492.1 iron complex transport system ATP-binding protein [Pontibaca methylaminivorans]
MALDLTVRGLSWGPRPDRRIIEDISFDVPAGTTTAIVGANGAGKSTLLRSIYRHNRPLSGQVQVGGRDIWRLSAREVSRLVAAVLQEGAPDFSFTLREVVAMGRIPHRNGQPRAGADEAVIDRVLAEFGLTDMADRTFGSLSGGEKQRVLLARAMVQEPQLIVLDEPTNHLDIRHQLEIMALLGRIRATVLITLHDLELAAAVADQVLVMRGGRVCALGPPGETLTPATIRTAFDVAATITEAATGRPRFSFDLIS